MADTRLRTEGRGLHTRRYIHSAHNAQASPSGRAVLDVVCVRSPAEISGSNPTGGMNVRLIYLLTAIG